MEDVTQIATQVTELAYALDTFYFLVCGALVMWMAAGFTMLESGLVRAKNTAEILTKNVGLYSIACIMYMVVGYNIMYPGEAVSSWFPGISFFLGADNTAEDVIASAVALEHEAIIARDAGLGISAEHGFVGGPRGRARAVTGGLRGLLRGHPARRARRQRRRGG